MGHVTVTGGVPSGQGVLYNLTKLQTDINNNDFSSISADVTALQGDQANVSGLQAQVGLTTDQLQTVSNRLTSQTTNDTQNIANVQDVDVATAVTQLNTQQTLYQSSIDVMSKIMQDNLVNFLS